MPADENVTRPLVPLAVRLYLVSLYYFVTAGLVKKQHVYNDFISGAKKGIWVAVKIVPYLVAMLMAISVFRTSGCMDYVVNGMANWLALCGLRTELLPTCP
jgi:spore maturation protein SpmB